MDYPRDQIDEIKKLFGEVRSCDESGYTYFFIPNLPLPEGCIPEKVDVLLCPTSRGDGYSSRLFFAEKIESRKSLNWNVNGIRIIERNWYAFSWQTPKNLRLAAMVAIHLRAFQ